MDLLEWSELKCRNADPSTSLIAAKAAALKLVGLRLQLVEGVTRCGGQATSKEAAAMVAENYELRESIRKRAAECVSAGALQVIGNRCCNVSGNRSQVYGLVGK